MLNETVVPQEQTAPELCICPQLGLRDDPGTQAAYPRLDHFCARRPTSDLSLNWQSQYCLQGQYRGCPHFQRGHSEQPGQARQPGLERYGRRWAFLLFGLMALISASAAVIGVMLATNPGGS